ncbi:hypothetical protein AWB76_02803 [Caballeronia temeraria]|uniref:Uncharacterized protein n=1 Tax=Caballeronia temeraria TaxID=1777137 RepID=A0A158APG9_9BURK|nr:hypothetical protein [Caballeronia temeraria]SAK59734.1 hypothetical protein AWB76_02803 [Caballeronia temeraria]
MLQEVEGTTSTLLTRSKRCPNRAIERNSDGYTRALMRVRHVQDIAHRQSVEIRLRQGRHISIPDFNDRIREAQRSLLPALADYRHFTMALSVLDVEAYRSIENVFTVNANVAVRCCEDARQFAVPLAGVTLTIQEHMTRVRDALGDICAAAEPILAWLEMRGGVQIETVLVTAQ